MAAQGHVDLLILAIEQLPEDRILDSISLG